MNRSANYRGCLILAALLPAGIGCGDGEMRRPPRRTSAPSAAVILSRASAKLESGGIRIHVEPGHPEEDLAYVLRLETDVLAGTREESAFVR